MPPLSLVTGLELDSFPLTIPVGLTFLVEDCRVSNNDTKNSVKVKLYSQKNAFHAYTGILWSAWSHFAIHLLLK